MEGRVIWKGYIHFEGFDMPVKLRTAVREEQIRFHLLHKRDLVRLKQQMICMYENVPVPTEEQTRGFELEKGRYILIDPEELEKTEPGDSRLIEVHEFVKSAQISPVYSENLYYLEPDISTAGYGALAVALEAMDIQGICTWTMRRRSYIGALQGRQGTLRLNTLRYADEVMSLDAPILPDIPLTDKELKIAGDLIHQLTAPFQPEKFQNEHQKKLLSLIDKKARGEKISQVRPRRQKPTTADQLLQVLEASLKKVA